MEDDWASLLATERHARIRSALDRFRGESGLYIDPDIPPKKIANARITTQIPSDERVLGLIDCTLFGSAKNCILFGERWLYLHNSWTVSPAMYRGRSRHDYGKLATSKLAKSGTDISFDGGAFDCSGSGFSTAKMLDLLTTVQRAIAHGLTDERKPRDAISIAAHLVERDSLDASNELWPCGIATHADASIIEPPLERGWALEIGPIAHTPAIVRDFVIAVMRHASAFTGPVTQLIGLELTRGREFWRRDLSLVHWSRPVVVGGLVVLKGGAYWHGFDLETGEPRPIDVASLSRSARDQLVLADATIANPDSYAAFAADLACPNSLDASPPPLRAANRARRIYAATGVQEHAPALRFVDHRGIHHLHGDQRGELLSLAMTERHILAGTRERQLWIADATADRPAWSSRLDLPISVEHIAVGSDHVMIAGNNWLRCYR